MASKTGNPAGAESAGLGNVIVLAGSDTRVNTAAKLPPQVVIADGTGTVMKIVASAKAARAWLRRAARC